MCYSFGSTNDMLCCGVVHDSNHHHLRVLVLMYHGIPYTMSSSALSTRVGWLILIRYISTWYTTDVLWYQVCPIVVDRSTTTLFMGCIRNSEFLDEKGISKECLLFRYEFFY